MEGAPGMGATPPLEATVAGGTTFHGPSRIGQVWRTCRVWGASYPPAAAPAAGIERRQRSNRGGQSPMSILGTRVLRTEDPRFLTTGGVYTEDLADERLAGACHVFFVRSPIAHARIRGIDVTAALAAPGVLAVYTAADVADLPNIEPIMADLVNPNMTRPLLAAGKVRFVGEPVAAVVTEGAYQGEDAIELVDVDY